MRGLWTASVIVMLALFVVALAVGPVAIPMHDLWSSQIVRAVRLPRAVLALLVGAALGMSGGALQGVLRNGLAEPYLLGVSGGAAVGAVVAAMLGLAGPATTPLAALIGAVAAVVLVLIVARVGGGRGADPRVLIMAGVVVGAFANAAIMVALASAPADTVRGAVWWMMGSVADANWPGIAWLAGYVTVGGALLLLWAPEIDALALGDEAAAAIGVDVDRASRRIFLAAATVAAATVAAAGLVGFVGLVVPHIARSGGARASRAILGSSALVGAALVLAADIAARTVRPPADLPLGAITALVGVPFFLAPSALAMITVRDLVVRYDGAPELALDGVTLGAERGALTALVGPNGSGKSTLVRAMIGRVPVERGSIRIDDEDALALSRRAFARRVAVVTQRDEPAFPLLGREYVALGRYAHGGLFRTAQSDDPAVDKAAERAGVAQFLNRRTDQLSGGEWQRLRIARALAQGGEALVLDEPTTFLDVGHEMALFELLADLARGGLAVLLVSHQLNLVARFAEQVVLLHHGKVAASGTPGDVMQGAILESVYEWPLVVTHDPAVGAPMLVPLRR